MESFAAYTKVVVDALSEDVSYWMTLNESQCFVGLGYVLGIHAPFLKKPESAGKITRNVMMAHGKSVQIIRKYAKKPPIIGMAPSGGGLTLATTDEKDIQKAYEANYSEEAGVLGNSWWMDLIILGEILDVLKPHISLQDIETICQPLDFYGFNIYNTSRLAEDSKEGTAPACPGQPHTTMDWDITPECLYWLTKFHHERYKLPVLITENGMANIDFIMLDGGVHDLYYFEKWTVSVVK